MADKHLKYLWYAKDIYPFYRRDGFRIPLTDPDRKRLLKGDFGELEAYERVHATFQAEKEADWLGDDTIISGSLRHGIVEFQKSPEWKELKPKTRKTYNVEFKWLLTPPGIPANADPAKPKTMRHKGHGHRPLAVMDAEVVIGLRDLRYDPPADMRYSGLHTGPFPGAANGLLGSLGALCAFVKLRPRQFRLPRGWTSPTLGVPSLKGGDGYRPWEELEEIEVFCKTWKVGTLQRVLFDTYLHTGQRGIDVWGMKRAHYRQVRQRRDDGLGEFVSDREIYVMQEKTGVRVWIPTTDDLIPVLDAHLASHQGDWFFVTQYGKHMSQGHMTQILADAIKDAGLSDECQPHGLRVTFATRMIELGLDHQDIESIVGHTNMEMARKYTEKRRRARFGIATLNAGLAAHRAGRALLVDAD